MVTQRCVSIVEMYFYGDSEVSFYGDLEVCVYGNPEMCFYSDPEVCFYGDSNSYQFDNQYQLPYSMFASGGKLLVARLNLA